MRINTCLRGLAVTAFLAGGATAQYARPGELPHEFVQQAGKETFQVLLSQDPDKEKERKLLVVYKEYADTKLIATRLLGPDVRVVRRAGSEAEVQKLLDLYVVRNLIRLGNRYLSDRDATFLVEKHYTTEGTFVMVQSSISAGQSAPVNVLWTLKKTEHGYKFISVSFEGRDLVLTHRTELRALFKSVGEASAFLRKLEEKVKKILE